MSRSHIDCPSPSPPPLPAPAIAHKRATCAAWSVRLVGAFVPVLMTLAHLAASDAHAQQVDPGLKVRHSRTTGLASFVTSSDGGPIFESGNVARTIPSVNEFFRVYGQLFGVTDAAAQLAVAKVQRDALGASHTSFRQMHRSVPVFSGVLKVHQDTLGRVFAANGDFYPIDAGLSVIPVLSAEQAVAAAAYEVESATPNVERRELVIVDPGWYGDPPIGAHLAYYVVLSDLSAGVREAFFVDAHTGKALDQWSLLEQVRDRRIHDGMGLSALPGELARAEGDPPVESPVDADRAYDYYGDTYDYYARAYGRDSMDDLGLPMVATVNSRAPGCPNAFWSDNLLQMAFCEGTVTDDVTAHELTHGVTTFTADLIYQNQSGQLNESFSDVFGELADLFNGDAAFVDGDNAGQWPTHPTGAGLDFPNLRRTGCSPRPGYPDGVRWLVAEDAAAFGGAIRDMWDPTCLGDPDRAGSELQTCGSGDNGGVHSGSGIPNHAFAIAVDGKAFNGYAVRGVGPIKAGAVWYRALTTYLTPVSDFQEAYAGLNQAAHDLIGQFLPDPRTAAPIGDPFTAADAAQIDLALRAVEMDTPGRCGRTIAILDPEPPPPCGNTTPIFADDFESGAPGWTVSSTSPPTLYDWVLTNEPLPFDHPSAVWFCDDPDIGDCDKVDESSMHSLATPPIRLPDGVKFPLAQFTHYIDSERAYDGGNVSIRVNGRQWRTISGDFFEFNPYNSVLRAGTFNNTNPLAGREAWTGVGGRWGTSRINLSAFASAGDTIELRFDFGKDGCTGRTGWFIDDFAVFACGDCNRNGRGDQLDLHFTAASPPLGNIGVGSPQRLVLHSPPRAESDVRMRFSATADLFGEQNDESLLVSLNGAFLAEIFTNGASDCPRTPDVTELTVPASQFNGAASTGDIVMDIVATPAVSPTLCGGGSWVKVFLEYATSSVDRDGGGVPDECQNCAVAFAPLRAHDGLPMNRYLAFVPQTGGRFAAYRVRRSVSGDAPNLTGQSTMWVGPPHDDPAVSPAELPRQYARLQCGPYYTADWKGDGVVYVHGPEVVPGATYVVDAIDVACVQSNPLVALPRGFGRPLSYFSPTLLLATVSRWGDVVGAESIDPPDGRVDMMDVAAVVDRFANNPQAVSIQRADLHPAVPDQVVDFRDVSLVLDALQRRPYPFESRSTCPK